MMIRNNEETLYATAVLAALVLLLCFIATAHAATIYIWRDADGTRQYSDYCPVGEKCRVKQVGSSDGTGGQGKKGKGWKDTTTTDTSTTDTGTSADSGTTSDGTTADTSSTGGTTTTTGDSTAEPTPDETGGTTTAGDTTTDPGTSADSGTTSDGTAADTTSTGGTTTTTGDSTAGDTTTDTPTDNTAQLEWDPVNDPDLAGYRVYHAVAGAPYPPFGSGINAGSQTTITISRLDSGMRYYFRVTAVDNAGNESGFSNEVYKDIP